MSDKIATSVNSTKSDEFSNREENIKDEVKTRSDEYKTKVSWQSMAVDSIVNPDPDMGEDDRLRQKIDTFCFSRDSRGIDGKSQHEGSPSTGPRVKKLRER